MTASDNRNDNEQANQEVSSFDTRYIISGLIFVLIFIDLVSESITLSWIHIALVVLAILPWLHSFMDSFDISATGFKAKFRELQENVDTIVDATSEPETEAVADESGEASSSVAPSVISAQQRNILEALVNTRFALRSKSGIRKDANLAAGDNLKDMLNELVSNGLVRERRGKKGNPLWAITTKGMAALEGQSS